MAELKAPVIEILKWNESAACYYCGGEASGRPDFEDWSFLDGRTYCPECAARESLH